MESSNYQGNGVGYFFRSGTRKQTSSDTKISKKVEEMAAPSAGLMDRQQMDVEQESIITKPLEETSGGKSEVRASGDVINDVILRGKNQWNPGYEETITDFTKVRSNFITFQQWRRSVEITLKDYWGPRGLILLSLSKKLEFPELKRLSFDINSYATVTSFLDYVEELWKGTQAPAAKSPVLVKTETETWSDYLERLQIWTHGTRSATFSDEWYMEQIRANITMSQDVFIGQDISPKEWVTRMDILARRYKQEKASSVALVATEEEEEPQEAIVDAVSRTQKHRFTPDGRPICDKCQHVGHIARYCPLKKLQQRRRKQYNNKRLVYIIQKDHGDPIVINARVCSQEIKAMLDCGAMVNVIDINILRRALPNIHLQHYSRRLIGADKKPIHAVGATHIPITINNCPKKLFCVAVKNLNNDLIVGIPGLKELGITIDFAKSEIKMGNKIIDPLWPKLHNKEINSVLSYNIDQNLTEDQQKQMQKITEKWAHTLVETIQDRGPAKGYKFSIDTHDTKPIYVPLRTYSPKEQDELDRQIEDMLAKHIITRIRSPWSAPVLLVKKKDGSDRVVVDYTRLNAKTEDDPYPLPVPRTAFQVLNNAQYYSSLDLASGYWQIEIAKKDIAKTAFNTRKGTFAYLRMPMGLKGAPSAFQRFMTEIFSDLMYRGVLVFIDDILIYSATWEEHLKLVDEVLKRLSVHNLQAKVGKCHFGAKEIKYLGSVISYKCRKPDPDKVKAIKEMEPPKSKDDVRSVLGLASFYREFIPNLSSIQEPIQKLMEKNAQFVWGPEQQKAFDTIKQSISTKSCLEIPEPDWEYELHTDASLSGIGAVLFQRDPAGRLHTIEFASKSLSKAQRKQAIPVLECYAIVWALKKFRCYIHGVHVKIFTDHYGLQFMKQKKDPPAQIQRWWWDIADYDFEIIYKQGKKNIADPLSRLMPQSQLDEEDAHDMELIAGISQEVRKHNKVVEILERRIRGHRREYLVKWNSSSGPKSWETRFSIKNPQLVDGFDKKWDALEQQRDLEAMSQIRKNIKRDEVIKAQKDDHEFQQIFRALNGEEVNQSVAKDAEQCLIVDGGLYHKDSRKRSIDGQLQLAIPKIFRRQLIEEIHGGVLGGHFGVQKTIDAVRRYYWWHGVKQDVAEVVKGCPNCNARNPIRGASKPLLEQEERTAIPWERVGIDYTDMAKSNDGYSKIIVIIDHATKYVIAKPTKDASAETAAKIIFEELICKYGCPKELWSDRGKAFIGEVVKYLAELFQIKQKFTSGYHPQTNGLTERFNRTIANELAKAVNSKKDDWPIWLQAKVFAYNNTTQSSTKYSPFQLIHTYSPRTPIDNELAAPPENFKRKEWAEKAHELAVEMRQDALKNQTSAAKSQKHTYDKGLKPTTFNVGDYVRVYDPTAEAKEPVKLRNQYVGPFRVRGRKGSLFTLEDLKGATIKGLFHPSKLKLVNEEGKGKGQTSPNQSSTLQEATSTGGEV